MFVNTVGTDTCLNQVSKKTKKNIKNNENNYNIFEMFPEEITEKNVLKIDYKKIKKHRIEFEKSVEYKKSLIWWKQCRKNRI